MLQAQREKNTELPLSLHYYTVLTIEKHTHNQFNSLLFQRGAVCMLIFNAKFLHQHHVVASDGGVFLDPEVLRKRFAIDLPVTIFAPREFQ